MTLKWASAAGLQSITAGMEWPSVTGTPTIETTIKRDSGAAFRIAPGATKQLQHNAYSSGQGVHYYRGYFYLVTAPAATRPIFSVDNGANRKIEVRMTTGRVLQLFNNEDSAQIGSNSSAVNTGEFYRLELKVDSTTLATTSVEARLYAAASESTLAWNPSGTADMSVDPNRLSVLNNNDTNLDIVWTDLVIIRGDGTAPNTWAGQGSIVYLRPNATGSNNAWTRGGADSGANWSQTDETPPNDATDYVESNTSGQIDDYNLDATPSAVASSDAINWVVPGGRFAISSTTGGDPDFVYRITAGGNTDESGNVSGAGATTYASYQTTPVCVFPMVSVDLPGASTTAWSKSDLDSAQIGIRESASDTHLARVSALWLMFDHKPTTAQNYTQDVSGGITPSGTVTKQDNKALSGGISSIVGTITKQGNKTVSGSISTITGALTKSSSKILSGALSSIVGSVTKQTAKIFSGDLTLAGILQTARVVLLSLSGGITPTGTTNAETNKSFSGNLTSAGSLLKSASRSLAGNLTSSGSTTKTTNKAFAGTLTSAGSLVKQARKFLSGVVTLAGDLATQFGSGAQTYFKDLSGSLTPTGEVLKSTAKSFVGSLLPSGSLTRLTGKLSSGTLTSSGSLFKLSTKSLSGAISSISGSILKQSSKVLAGGITPTGNVTAYSIFTVILQGTLAFAGSITKRANKNLTGNVSPLGTVNKSVSKFLSGILNSVGNLLAFISGTQPTPKKVYLLGSRIVEIDLDGSRELSVSLDGGRQVDIGLNGRK